MNNSHIHFTYHILEQALRTYLTANFLRAHGFLSRKREGVVVLVSEPGSATPDHKWIVRISPYTPNHKTYQFGKHWHNRDCEFLPRIYEPEYHKHKSTYFVVEKYEFIGTPPEDTEVGHNGEFPSTCFTDLFQFVVANGAHKSMKYLYSALCGLAELHDQEWYHLDFSLENVACDENGRGALIDYEAASYIMHEFVPQREVAKSYKITYAAPEVKRGDTLVHPAGVDVWAFGVALYLTITQDYPFNTRGPYGNIDRKTLFDFVAEHGFMAYLLHYKPKFADKIHEYPHLADLLEQIFLVYPKRFSPGYHKNIHLCSVDGRERLSAAEIRAHPFWEPYLQDEGLQEQKILASDIVAVDADCQIAPENIKRDASWWMLEA